MLQTEFDIKFIENHTVLTTKIVVAESVVKCNEMTIMRQKQAG